MKSKHFAGGILKLSSSSGLLQRWAHRKSQARQSRLIQNDSQLSDKLNTPADDSENSSGTTQQPVKSDSDMPAIESLTEHSDIIDFLSEGVSEELRKIALRKLFHMPNFNIRDGLDDYDENYRNFTSLGNLITSDMRYEMERIAMLEEETSPVDTVAETNSDRETMSAESRLSDEPMETAAVESNETNDSAIDHKDTPG